MVPRLRLPRIVNVIIVAGDRVGRDVLRLDNLPIELEDNAPCVARIRPHTEWDIEIDGAAIA
ncbi:MAG: hypothetical protein DLM52_13385 [Chthoniobacterales bacterium]|nr:MAG: hypothetical protein DLM52_13385 [Chthoniobacterales bacterium]